MKGYYITYGIFSSDLEKIVIDLEKDLGITLIKGGYDEDEELYYLDTTNKHNISHFSIHNGDAMGYHLSGSEILYTKYLISCNVVFDQNECDKIEYIQQLRNILENKEYIKELNFDTDEW